MLKLFYQGFLLCSFFFFPLFGFCFLCVSFNYLFSFWRVVCQGFLCLHTLRGSRNNFLKFILGQSGRDPLLMNIWFVYLYFFFVCLFVVVVVVIVSCFCSGWMNPLYFESLFGVLWTIPFHVRVLADRTGTLQKAISSLFGIDSVENRSMFEVPLSSRVDSCISSVSLRFSSFITSSSRTSGCLCF